MCHCSIIFCLIGDHVQADASQGEAQDVSILLCQRYGALAQSVEHLTFNQVVGGSNPPCFTRKKLKRLLFDFISGCGGTGRRARLRI